ncbi:hypothetical protein ABEF92_005132 [Exophiala dermatitidis]|uniref:F-box domain-containing protein n=1 Tax=Exophiala dermatitidis (strain ATCC 34100 / CBS 525.76 / NIH/UT8656) TaxID=858893 RepID=H6C034_EXODN|nr:uncharacterized protein HMPREF1120_05231 [Exophiala dermatitidis NIH/UT8656]EHY57183.1 hypothetical protein HMPREF1120_05231 [Exophiala dermatitidis NIH/UT8656]
MTLRHPERLGPEGEYDDTSSSTGGDAWPGNQHDAHELAPMPAGDTASPQKKLGCDESPVLHPYATDFGPKTLIQYLESECDRQGSLSLIGKGKGKEVDNTIPAQPYQGNYSYGLYGDVHSYGNQARKGPHGSYAADAFYHSEAAGRPATGANPTAHSTRPTMQPLLTHELLKTRTPVLGNITNSVPGSDDSKSGPSYASTAGRRRSQRLAQKEVASEDPGRDEPTIASTSTPTAQNATNQLPWGNAPTSNWGPGDFSRSSRTTNFEEHTKTKRQAVREGALEAPFVQEGNPAHLHKKTRRGQAAVVTASPTFRVDSIAGSSLLTAADAESQSLKLPVITLGRRSVPDTACQSDRPAGNIAISPSVTADLSTSKIRKSLHHVRSGQNYGLQPRKHSIPTFNYGAIVPEHIPWSEKENFVNAMEGVSLEPETHSQSETVNEAEAANDFSSPAPSKYPRMWAASRPKDIKSCGSRFSIARVPVEPGAAIPTLLEDFNPDLWMGIARYLSTQDVKRLRLVNRSFARSLEPIVFRNVVINFGKTFFDVNDGNSDSEGVWTPTNSIFQKYGSKINQFGVSFEYDVHGLCQAKSKVIAKEQTAWFGTFTWPMEQYPRFPALQAVEDLVDHNRPLLKEALKHVTKASELGLCIDSGHGWLEGPDISDLALFNRRVANGSKVFGKTFPTEDSWTAFARNEYFRWAQQNTINETVKHILGDERPERAIALHELRFLESVEIRDIDSFKSQAQQPDYEPEVHVGGGMPGLPNLPLPPPALANWAPVDAATARRIRRASARRRSPPRRHLQWPLIFSGHNIAAEVGGHCTFVQEKTAHPANSPLRPGRLTEAQAQWLMETVWAQRAFLSAYTTAIITNKQNFKSIHSVRISKLSSGLLPSLEQNEFWDSLPGLKHLQILISPDWRQEHCIGDRFHQDNMPISPAKAAVSFTQFLRKYVTKMERLHSLTIGYVGGGEHAVGMFARNQHVLPAPIIIDPAAWLHGAPDEKELPDMTKFDHIRDLKFENCWFSPSMLEGFMKKSRDTSLHSLTLDSVSMIAYHDATLEHPLTTAGDNLSCEYGPYNWYREELPTSAAWCRVLDRITPGMTIKERKEQSKFLHRNSPEPPPPTQRPFRGNVEKIVLNSCGYVKISVPNVLTRAYKQNAAVIHSHTPKDGGILARMERFNAQTNPPLATEVQVPGMPPPPPPPPPPQAAATVAVVRPRRRRRGSHSDNAAANRIMMSGSEYPWLGILTQCVHPIEMRVLERGWRMTFGWPDNLERWAAVEDGFFEGGTGRFSGIVERDWVQPDDDLF